MKRKHIFILSSLIFGAAFLIRLFYVLQLRTSPYFYFPILDPLAYHDWALNIARGDWMGQYVFRQAPLYPYILAVLYRVIGPDLMAVRLLQIAMGSLSCVLIYRVGAACLGKRTGITAGVLSCFYVPFIFYEGMVIKTSLGIFLNLLLVLLLLSCRARSRYWNFLGAGILLGLSALVRENVLILAPVLALWLAVTARKSGLVALFLAGVIIVIAPVTLRNYIVGGEFVPIACNFGFTLYSGNNPGADGTQQPPEAVRRTPEFEYPDYKLLAERAVGRSLGPTEVSRFWAGRAQEFAGRYPLIALKLLLRKLALFWNSYEIADNHNLYFFKTRHSALQIIPLGFGVIGPLCLLGMALSVRRWRRCLVLYLFIFSYMISVVAFYVSARFRLPAVPYLIIFASAGLTSIYDLIMRKRWGGLSLALLLLAPLWVLMNMEIFTPIEFDAEYYNLGETCNKAGLVEEALATYKKAVETNPSHAAAYNNMGTLYDSIGREKEAISSFRMAVKINPGYSLAHYNLALALLKSGEESLAEKEIALAIKTDPGYVDPHFKLGLYHNIRGEPDKAVAEFRKALSGRGNKAVIHDHIGTIHLERGRKEEALEEFTLAVRADPRYAEGYNKLGVLRAQAGDRDGARRLFLKSISLDPLNARARSNLGSTCLERGDINEAIRHYEETIRISPELAETYNLLAIAYQQKGDLETASRLSRKALELTRMNEAGKKGTY